jgi:Protein of unknown function, DUF547
LNFAARPTRRVFLALAFMASAPAAWSATFDHSAFDALLRKHVVEGMVDYDAFKASPEFPKYLGALSKADPAALDDQERLAYWINVYNAYTIELINSHQERVSIRNINKTLGIAAKGPWHELLVKAGGQVYHLDNVEHGIIRKQWKEPRIHFALVCAAMSCPPLRSEAYTGAKLEGQLSDQARKFLGSPAKNRIDLNSATVYGSPIYASYYREDFGSSDRAIGKYLSQFYPEGAEKQLLLSGRFKLIPTDYDWTLNSQEQQAKKLATPAVKP